ncbi:MAG: hypothetical protein JWO67_2689 [Streptosporangiaceae bacterium]|nr:hypothetical protein [Streptosporangiaceae bacterium]
MNAITDPLGEVREEVHAQLHELETRLVAHGFRVEVEEKFWLLRVTHSADKLSPARSVRVQIATGPGRRLDWYWVRDAIEDVEHLAPAAAIAEVTEAIARALHRGDVR